MKTHNDLIKLMFNKKYHSVFWAILGPNQSGKTDMALWLSEKAYERDLFYAYCGNIESVKGVPYEYHFVNDLESLKQFCMMINPDPYKKGLKRILFLADEMGEWAPKDQPWLNVKLIKEQQKVRKYGLSMIGMGISRVDSRILNPKHFHGRIDKVGKNRQDRAVFYDWLNNQKGKIYNIPRTTIAFNTWDSSYFYMEKQIDSLKGIPLNLDHELVKLYLEKESFTVDGHHPQEVKRAVLAVLDYHFKHCLPSTTKEEMPFTASQVAS